MVRRNFLKEFAEFILKVLITAFGVGVFSIMTILFS